MAVEVWFLRRMLRISWTEKKSNLEVLRAVGVQRTMRVKITLTNINIPLGFLEYFTIAIPISSQEYENPRRTFELSECFLL